MTTLEVVFLIAVGLESAAVLVGWVIGYRRGFRAGVRSERRP
jgi:hypothetical protein